MDLTKERFGRLRVLGLMGVTPTVWMCRCECGELALVTRKQLRRGGTRSCGCLKREVIASGPSTTHGMSKSGTYRSWQAMLTRCTNPNAPKYRDYGARGISICPQWMESFDAFLADLGPRPPGATLDRRDVDGNYDPINAHWASAIEQARNKRNNHRLTAGDRTQTLAAWSVESGTPEATIRARKRRGWSDERAIFAPVDTRFHKRAAS